MFNFFMRIPNPPLQLEHLCKEWRKVGDLKLFRGCFAVISSGLFLTGAGGGEAFET